VATIFGGLQEGERVALYRDDRPVLYGIVLGVSAKLGVLLLTTTRTEAGEEQIEQVLLKPELLALPGISFEPLGRLS
jgi:hypothetical protein